MENCLSFIKDNIQDQAFKTWFEPIKSVELTDNALYIQVPSKFFRMVRRALCKTIKVALTKNLVKCKVTL
jgi:chromosomal replication initiator protein